MSTDLRFRPLTAIFEPSAVQQLADGRFLIAEDECAQPFTILTIAADGRVSTQPLLDERTGPGTGLPRLDDLEALTGDAHGFIYAITSHSRDGDGDEKKARERLVRFRVEGDRALSPVVVGDLKSALVAAHPILAESAAVGDVKNDGGLNIEALEATPDGRLLVGFRGPVDERGALIAVVENAAGMFDAGEAPRIAPRLLTLDLGGDGIRALARIPVLDGYLVVSGPVARKEAQFGLWFWRGEGDEPPRRVAAPGLPGFEHAEGVSAARVDGAERILIVSDDGDRKKGRCANYLLLDPADLRIGN